MKVIKMAVVAVFILWAFIINIRVTLLESEMEMLVQRMTTYEDRTREVLNNYNDMRKTQLNLMDIYEKQSRL